MNILSINIRNKKLVLVILAFLSISTVSYSQDAVIKSIIENLTEKSEQEFDYSDLMDEFLELQAQPLNINSAEESEKLIKLYLLDELLYQNLLQYIDTNGQLLSPQELLLVEGFTITDVQNLLPFVKAEQLNAKIYPKASKIFRYGRHEVFLRYQRTLQDTDGFKNRTDSILNENPNSKYLGNPDKYYLKYKFKYRDKISAGLVAEKDAGELFLENIDHQLTDSLLGNSAKKGFDFYTGHLYASNLGVVNQAVIGDYHLQFGQGLNMWSTLSFGKSTAALNIKKYGRGIKPNSSANENKFLRGFAVKWKMKNWSLITFYSQKKQDATDLQSNEDQETNYLSSLNGTGFHRTVNELLKKNAVEVKVFGARLSFSNKHFRAGITGVHSELDKELLAGQAPYQLFQFSGTKNTVLGGDYEFRLLMLNFFGEMSLRQNGSWAYVGGVTAPLNNRFALAILYRNYQKDYVNLFGAAFGESTLNNNEQGFYTGINFQVSQKVQLNAYADIFNFPWLKFRIDAPSKGSDYLAQVNYEFSRRVQMHFKARYKAKMVNYQKENGAINLLQEQEKYSIRYHISYQLLPQLTLKNRVEYQIFETATSGKQAGFLIFQDINYKSKSQKWGITTRFSLFDVEDYNSRIYAYENDLLYVFSVPAYYNRGIRVYGLLSYKFTSKIQFWMKLAHTWYENVDELGSGLNRIDGQYKTEFRCQLRIKI